MADLSAGQAKLVQYLNEAYGTEKRLETALQEHIATTVRPAYKKRLKEHLSETKRHARDVKQSIKRLGGVAETVSAPPPIAEAAHLVVEGAHRAVAFAQGSLHALRPTGEDETQLANAKAEYASESAEIATYTAIETLAEALGDGVTQRLARAIRRDEERMRAFLEREIPRLTRAVVKAEIPPSQRTVAAPAGKAPAAPKAKPAPAGKAKPAPARKAKPAAARKAKPAAGGKAKSAAARKAKPAAGAGRAAGKAKAAPKGRPRGSS